MTMADPEGYLTVDVVADLLGTTYPAFFSICICCWNFDDGMLIFDYWCAVKSFLFSNICKGELYSSLIVIFAAWF